MKSKKPIFVKLLHPLTVLTVVEIMILVFTLFGQNLLHKLNQNEKNVLLSRVTARKNYLESMMVNDWRSLDDTFSKVISITEAYMEEYGLTLEQLDDSSKNAGPLLAELTPSLIKMMRDNRVNDAYLIFNTENISDGDVISEKPGLYIRDRDPSSLASEQNEDLFIKVSPSEVLHDSNIPTDAAWDIYFRFKDKNDPFRELLSISYKTASESNEKYSWKDMGRWSIPEGSKIKNDPILTYTVPLVLSDGSVVGIMGISITYDYLSKMLPSEELGFENNASYILSKYDAEKDIYTNTFECGKQVEFEPSEGGNKLGKNSFICSEKLRLYDTNTPFSSDTWVIAGVVEEKYMEKFSDDLITATALAVMMALLVGVLGSFLIAYLLQKPIKKLAGEISSADSRKNLKLTPTGLREIDSMSEAIMNLSYDILESGRKFSKIIEMSSVQMSGFQINRIMNTLFLTEDFFSLFGEDNIDQTEMKVEEFKELMQRYEDYVTESSENGLEHMLCVPTKGKHRYIRLCLHETEHHCYGLAEDVTREVLEKQVLQHERDHDPLTNLYNRRAFRSKLNTALKLPKNKLKRAALIMIDLDNLKYFNDTFGHDCGDQYIFEAASSIENAITGEAICARISGDEFNVFLYGYETEENLSAQIKQLQQAVNSGKITIPDGSTHYVHATGGVAYYPEHSKMVDDLSKYADYAMYIAKRNHKRSFQVFDPEMFRSQDIQLRNSEALTKMLQYSLVHYALQPIVDAKNGEIFAYEALMRPDVDSFFTVFDAMETAKRDGKLDQIEEMTLFKALETFDDNIKLGNIAPNTHLFVNSIPNQCVSVEKGELFVEKYGKYAKQLVLELTEEVKLDKDIWELKEYHHRSLGGKIALDDYGSGYNSEKTLLDISPDYIKVDMSIIRDIHADTDKQSIVENIVSYAHDRGKCIIAEGVETEAEVKKLVELNVDYMQGYFFGKPFQAPQEIPKEAIKALGI